jgi:phosphatidylinositol alpha-mannosyltransferase
VKVAVVSPYDLGAPGGVQDQVVSLVSWLRQDGHVAWAVAPGSGGPDGTRHVGGVLGVPVNRSRAPINLSPLAVRRVAAAVSDADVVHVHEPFVPSVGLGVLFADTAPRVGTFHSDPGAGVRGLYRIGVAVFRRLSRRLAVATAVSPVARDAVAGFVDARIVPNGLDVAALGSDTEKVPGRVVFVGRDERRKGLDVLLQAWPIVRSVVPHAELRVISTARTSGPAGVTFLGRVDGETKCAELAAASVLCAPNLGGESFGLVVAEGMAAGCAVVASDLPAFKAVAGEAAVYVRAGDSNALAAALAEMAGDAAAAAAAGEASRRAAQRFDRSVVLGGYVGAYLDALSAQ